MRKLGQTVYRHRRVVLGAWLLLAVAGVLAGGRASGRLEAEFLGSNDLESVQVRHQLEDALDTGGSAAIVIDGVPIDDPAVAGEIAPSLAALRQVEGVTSVVDPWSTPAPGLAAVDGQAALVVVNLGGGLTSDAEHAIVEQITAIATGIDAPRVLVGGELVIGEEFREAAERDLQRAEFIAVPIALLAMVVILGGVRAALVPILVAVGSILASLIVVLAATGVTTVSIFAINVLTMLGLGLGIDYGLLMVSRFREERAEGTSVADAVAATVATAGTTVLFSALTVAVAMSGLFVFGDPTFTSFGIAGAAVVLLAATAGLTLVPALLGVWGPRLRPARRRPSDHGVFYRLSRLVQRRAGVVVTVVGVGLALLAVPFLGARIEDGDARSLPRSSVAREVATVLAERFPARGADPVVVVAEAPATSPALEGWLAEITARADVAGVSVRPTTGTTATVVEIVPDGQSVGPEAKQLVRELRAADPGFELAVGGRAASLVDSSERIANRLPWAIAVMVAATFVLLFLMTGSLAVPAKAVVMNLLSLGASFGALVWVFQDGHLSGLLGFDPIGSVDLWMPVLIFIFAFGLSMDYEVFLLSRIKEIHDRTGDNEQAVALGLQRSGRIITSAALLIVVVFAGFAAGEVLSIKQLGLGMALAVIIDATIVRSLLVPATMRLLGEWNWWAPPPLRRFHERFGLHETAPVPTATAAEPAPARTAA